MLVVSLFSWWYGLGWLTLGRKVTLRIHGVLEFFSVWQLMGSLFAPFRQISAGRVQGPLGVQLRAWGDKQFSRFIGAVVRLLLIGCGFLGVCIYAFFGLALMLLWPFLPLLPLIGFIFMALGVLL